MEFTRNYVQGEINMPYSYITKNLIGLMQVSMMQVWRAEYETIPNFV